MMMSFGKMVELGPHAGEVPLAVERPLGDHETPAVLLDGLVQLQDIVEDEIGDLVRASGPRLGARRCRSR